ncbi:MAG: hypothetical protein MI717_08190 [Spirochaetales bacterium]|nr:hypothetical protein [Spirochaetales bacterium]
MFQLYLLTVLTTVLSGVALASSFLAVRFDRFSDYTEFMENSWYRLVLGAVTLIVGLINLFPTFPGDIAILGELFPSIAGISAGLLLVADFFANHRSEDEESATADLAERVGRFSGPYQTAVGIASVVIGILHAVLLNLPLL